MKNYIKINTKSIPILFAVLGGVGWVASNIFAFNGLEGPPQTGFAYQLFNVVYYFSLAFFVLAIVSFVYIYSKKYKILLTDSRL